MDGRCSWQKMFFGGFWGRFTEPTCLEQVSIAEAKVELRLRADGDEGSITKTHMNISKTHFLHLFNILTQLMSQRSEMEASTGQSCNHSAQQLMTHQNASLITSSNIFQHKEKKSVLPAGAPSPLHRFNL